MTAQGGSAWTVDIGGGGTRSCKAAGIEDWDWDRGAAPHCHFDRSEVEWRNLPVILWLVASGWWLGKPYNHPDGRGKGGPFGGWRHHLPIGGSVSLDSQSTASPYESSSLATRFAVGLWVLSVVLHDSDGSVERFILPLSGIITVEGNAV